MRIQRQSVGRLASLMLALSLLLGMALTGCSDKDTSYYCCGGNGNGQGGGGDDYLNRRHKIYYQFRQKNAAKAVEAGATHVAGFAYDDRANRDSEFSIAETEIAKMKKAKNGDYMAELDVSGRVTHIDLYFYYDEGKEKLATNCKYVPIDFASLLKEDKEIIVIDSDANDAYFTIKTYDGSGKETGRFASGDKVYAKVFVTCEGDESFYVPFPSPGSVNEDRTFTLGELVSDAADVVDNSTEKNDEYKVLKALAEGTANLYVYNLGFTCLFSEHEVNVGPVDPDFTALYLVPEGYTVSRDGTEILDPDGSSVDPSGLPKEQEIAAGASHTFVAIGAKKTADGTVYELMGNKADAVLTTDSRNINNDGFKVSVAAGATEADKAAIGAAYGGLASNTVQIKAAAPDAYTALYLAPEGYTVSRDGTKIFDPNGSSVSPSSLPKEQAIAAGGEHTFVAIGAKNGNAGVIYELLGDQAEAVLTTESANITNDGFKVSAAAAATSADVASIKAALDTLTSNAVNITVEGPVTYTALYLAPEGYTVSRDGSKILDPTGAEVAPSELPKKQVIFSGCEHTFVAIGAKDGDAGVTYELLGDKAAAVLTTDSRDITNDVFKVSVAAGAPSDDVANIRAALDTLTSNSVNIVSAKYVALYIAPNGYTVSADGKKILDLIDASVAPEDLPDSKTIEVGTAYAFRTVIGAYLDPADHESVLYEMVTDASPVFATESDMITNSGFTVIVARRASDDDTATIKAVRGSVESNAVTIRAVPYATLSVCWAGDYEISRDKTKYYDPDYYDPDDRDTYFNVADFLMGVDFGSNAATCYFQIIAADSVREELIQIDINDVDLEIELLGDPEDPDYQPDHFEVDLANSAVKFKDDTEDGVACYVQAKYRGLESEPEAFIVTAN